MGRNDGVEEAGEGGQQGYGLSSSLFRSLPSSLSLARMEPLQGVLMRSAEGVRSLSKTRHGTLLKSISKVSRKHLAAVCGASCGAPCGTSVGMSIGAPVGWPRERFVVVPECSLEGI